MAKVNLQIIYYSLHGHIRRLAQEIKKGCEQVPGVQATLYQVQETLPDDVLVKMHAVPKSDDPIITVDQLPHADGFLFGIPTRFGSACAQIKALMDATGQLWYQGKLHGKPGGVFFGTAIQGGGQETTALTFVTQFAHHGIVFVPFGCIEPGQKCMSEVHGGSPYGAGTYAGSDGSRQPTALELELALAQGKQFAKTAKALKLGREAIAADESK